MVCTRRLFKYQVYIPLRKWKTQQVRSATKGHVNSSNINPNCKPESATGETVTFIITINVNNIT